LLAEALRKAGNLRGASYYYQEALALAPGRTANRVNLGLCLYQLGDLAEAIQHLQQAVADVPDQEVALFNLGMIYRQSGERKAAKYYLRRYLAVADPMAAEMRALASRWLAEEAQGQ
jgi:Tfp pilus assembly protein PilF